MGIILFYISLVRLIIILLKAVVTLNQFLIHWSPMSLILRIIKFIIKTEKLEKFLLHLNLVQYFLKFFLKLGSQFFYYHFEVKGE